MDLETRLKKLEQIVTEQKTTEEWADERKLEAAR
jgi:hypothetical protein